MNLNNVHEIQPCCATQKDDKFFEFILTKQKLRKCQADRSRDKLDNQQHFFKKSCQIEDALNYKYNSRKSLISLCDAILNQTHARAMVRAHTLDVRRTYGQPHCTAHKSGRHICHVIKSFTRSHNPQSIVSGLSQCQVQSPLQDIILYSAENLKKICGLSGIFPL